jgi:hypothetical protein
MTIERMLPVGRQISRNQRLAARIDKTLVAEPRRKEGAMRSTAFMMVLLAGLAGLSGCQCCALTEHYACLIDWASDHERAEEISYHPGWDLNRIGRPDWCRCRLNRALCPCACSRVRPAPCGYVVCRETGRGVRDQVKHPDWSQSAPSQDGPEQTPLEDLSSEDAPLPPALQQGDVPQSPVEERGERDLLLP